ncbi:uncharacterized protein otp isoform X1 [Drosophila kikkawai]|uniref:Uncharacterized protein otp isoform X1 n=1 Tax=Drosophila kikkawai TaxID=30033 RepID=A0ABM4GD55_DROKI
MPKIQTKNPKNTNQFDPKFDPKRKSVSKNVNVCVLNCVMNLIKCAMNHIVLYESYPYSINKTPGQKQAEAPPHPLHARPAERAGALLLEDPLSGHLHARGDCHAHRPHRVPCSGLVPEPSRQVEEAQEDHECVPHPGRPPALARPAAVWGQYHQHSHGRRPLRHRNVWRGSLECGRQSHDGRRLHDVPAQCGRGQLRAEWFAERHHPAEHEQLLFGDPATPFRTAERQPERVEWRAYASSPATESPTTATAAVTPTTAAAAAGSPTATAANSPTAADGATDTHTAAGALPPVHAVTVRWRHRRGCVARTQHRGATPPGFGTKRHGDPLLPTPPCRRPQQLRAAANILKFVEELRKLFGLRVRQLRRHPRPGLGAQSPCRVGRKEEGLFRRMEGSVIR